MLSASQLSCTSSHVSVTPNWLHLVPFLVQPTRLLDLSLTLSSNHADFNVRQLDSSLSSLPMLTGFVNLQFITAWVSMSLSVSPTSCCIHPHSASLIFCIVDMCSRGLDSSQVTVLCVQSIVRVFTSNCSSCDSFCITS